MAIKVFNRKFVFDFYLLTKALTCASFRKESTFPSNTSRCGRKLVILKPNHDCVVCGLNSTEARSDFSNNAAISFVIRTVNMLAAAAVVRNFT